MDWKPYTQHKGKEPLTCTTVWGIKIIKSWTTCVWEWWEGVAMGHGQASHKAVDLSRSAFNGLQDVTALVEVLEHVFPEGRFAGCLFSAADSQGFLWFQYVFFLRFIFVTVRLTWVTFFVRLCWQIMRQFLHYKTIMSLKYCES